MSDAGATAPGGEPQMSEEELREYLGQMRAAPADAIVADVLQSLLQVAQVKLGREDGRLLLDTIAAVNDTTTGRVDPALTQQVTGVLTELRLAQVEAESEVAEAATQGHVEANDLVSTGAPSPGAGTGAADPTPASPPPPDPGAAGSRLWTPGT